MTLCSLTKYNDNPQSIILYTFTLLDLLLNYERCPKNICEGCGMPTGDAYSSGHLVPSHFGLAYVQLDETNPFPELVVNFPDYSFRTSLRSFSTLLIRHNSHFWSIYHKKKR